MNDNSRGHARSLAKDKHTLSTFVRSQVELLKTPLHLPENWRDSVQPQAEEDGLSLSNKPHHHQHREPIPGHVLAAGLRSLNVTTRKALSLNFSNQSVRQLLDQVAANRLQVERLHRQGGIVVRTKSRQELLETPWIEAFPVQWRNAHDTSSAGSSTSSSTLAPSNAQSLSDQPDVEQTRQYQQLRARIVDLQQKYHTTKEKHEYYKNLKNEIQLLDSDRLQANVVGPNTPISHELSKMKTLVPRLISILEVRKETMMAKRKRDLEALSKDLPDDESRSKRQHTGPTDPIETMLNLLQS
ncbi:hypothetical protein DFQ26_004458 [Actinomortierella ambigua]|nr:hypothetical protein DFQ26_004458 [Actinomortierella ambigua]